MRINDNEKLHALRTNVDKSKRRNKYIVKDLLFTQFYDASTDYLNPYNIYVYKDNNYVIGGVGPSIEDSYNNLITNLIQYNEQYRLERNEALNKLSSIIKIIRPIEDNEDNNQFQGVKNE